jgi:hypothetical protein
MEMENGRIFAKVMALAIKSEESQLKELSIKRPDLRHAIDTVHHYYEPWIWPAFIKQALKEQDCPELSWEEGGRIDCCFLGGDRKPTAAFELKPFFPAKSLNRNAFAKIQNDFEKQLERSKQIPGIEHYVVLVPYGDTSSVAEWTRKLLRTLREEYPDINIYEVQSEDPIALNHIEHGSAFVKAFRVTSLS